MARQRGFRLLVAGGRGSEGAVAGAVVVAAVVAAAVGLCVMGNAIRSVAVSVAVAVVLDPRPLLLDPVGPVAPSALLVWLPAEPLLAATFSMFPRASSRDESAAITVTILVTVEPAAGVAADVALGGSPDGTARPSTALRGVGVGAVPSSSADAGLLFKKS